MQPTTPRAGQPIGDNMTDTHLERAISDAIAEYDASVATADAKLATAAAEYATAAAKLAAARRPTDRG